jgi:hypothetical protein
MDTETIIESMRELCADEERLRELGLRLPINELVPAILATLDDLESGQLVVPGRAADS